MAIIQNNECYPILPVNNQQIMLEVRFTAILLAAPMPSVL